MQSNRRIYLDNAATSWPKPEAVYQAVDHYQRHVGAAVGRSAYREAVQLGEGVEFTRRAIALLMGVSDAQRMIFTFNATDSLNLALHGVLRDGNHVVTTTLEHNSVLRPLRWLAERKGIHITYVRPDETGVIRPGEIRAALRPETTLVVMTHASNVTGAIQPIAEVGDIARAHGALMLVDAAQTAGHLPMDLGQLPVDLLAASCHKGLLGPLGTGVLYVAPSVEDRLESVRQGGTGSRSEEDRQPNGLPDKYESGNHNALGLVGLRAGIEFLAARGIASIRAHEISLIERFLAGIDGLGALDLFGPRDETRQVGVISLNVQGYEPQELAALLESHFGIQVRSGIHCAPLAHRSLGTLDSGGTVRFSFGPFTSADDVDAATGALRELNEAASATHGKTADGKRPLVS